MGFRELVRLFNLLKPVRVEFLLGSYGQRPTKVYTTDACWDIYCSNDIEILPNSTSEVPTNLHVNIPVGFEGELKLRSGQGKLGLDIHHGAYDAGYQGELSPFIHNRTSEPYKVQKGDRICQFSLRRVIDIEWLKVNDFIRSNRGIKGHGSSGR